MFENLQERLERSFKILRARKDHRNNISATLKDIRRALLDADVSFRVAKDFCEKSRKGDGAEWLTAVNPSR